MVFHRANPGPQITQFTQIKRKKCISVLLSAFICVHLRLGRSPGWNTNFLLGCRLADGF